MSKRTVSNPKLKTWHVVMVRTQTFEIMVDACDVDSAYRIAETGTFAENDWKSQWDLDDHMMVAHMEEVKKNGKA